MDVFSNTTLFIILGVLIVISAFFSSSETGMTTLNRYRLRHRARQNDVGAKRVQQLLKSPDKLIGLILIGNNFVNILASALATVLAVRLWGDLGILIATVSLTLVILIFAEVTPKTLAALFPERIAYPAAIILKPLMSLLYPLVWLVNSIARALLRPFGVKAGHTINDDNLNQDELRSVVYDAGGLIPATHQRMLLSVLDLERVTVEDIMIPKAEVFGVNLEDDWDEILHSLQHLQHTRVPVFFGEIDDVRGMLHARDLSNLVSSSNELTRPQLLKSLRPVVYVPEGTPLNTQLVKFKAKRQRIGLVINEYGDIVGLVTLEDILEEIVGEFTTDIGDTTHPDIQSESNECFLVDGSITLRELNKTLNLEFSTNGPKTLSGIIVEYLEAIPLAGTGVRIANYPMDIIQVKDNRVKTVRLYTKLETADRDCKH